MLRLSARKEERVGRGVLVVANFSRLGIVVVEVAFNYATALDEFCKQRFACSNWEETASGDCPWKHGSELFGVSGKCFEVTIIIVKWLSVTIEIALTEYLVTLGLNSVWFDCCDLTLHFAFSFLHYGWFPCSLLLKEQHILTLIVL